MQCLQRDRVIPWLCLLFGLVARAVSLSQGVVIFFPASLPPELCIVYFFCSHQEKLVYLSRKIWAHGQAADNGKCTALALTNLVNSTQIE